jgi:hypothetical protein
MYNKNLYRNLWSEKLRKLYKSFLNSPTLTPPYYFIALTDLYLEAEGFL